MIVLIKKGLTLLSKHKQNAIFQQLAPAGFRQATWPSDSLLLFCRAGFRDVRNACNWHKDLNALLTGIVFAPSGGHVIYGTQYKRSQQQQGGAQKRQPLRQVSDDRLYMHGPILHRTPSMLSFDQDDQDKSLECITHVPFFYFMIHTITPELVQKLGRQVRTQWMRPSKQKQG